MFKNVAKSVIDTALDTRLGRAVAGGLSSHKATIFMMHRAEQPEFHQIGHRADTLQAMFDCLYDWGIPVLPLDTLVEHYVHNKPFDRFSVAFTIDDGFEDQGSILLPLFLENQIPVTTFLITNLANGKSWPWDYKIKYAILQTKKGRVSLELGCGSQLFDTSTLANQRQTYRDIIRRAKTFSTLALLHFLEELERETEVEIPTVPPDAHKPLTWEMARTLEQQGARFGPHSENHRSIAHLSDNEARAEIVGSWESMQRNLANPVPVFCWPIGRREDISRKTMQIIKEKDFLAGLSAQSGYINMHRPPVTLDEQFAIPRLPLPYDINYFKRLVSGMSGTRLNRKTVFNLSKRNSERPGLLSSVPLSRSQLKNELLTLAFRSGVFSRWSDIDWSDVNRLVFVCKGNICRSAYAEYRAKALGIDSVSRGIEAGDGASAPEDAQLCASFRGIDLSGHQAKRFDVNELRDGDLVIGMEPWHIDFQVQTLSAQSTLLGVWQHTPSVCIPDPFGKPLTEFTRVFTSIDRSIEVVAKELNDAKQIDKDN